MYSCKLEMQGYPTPAKIHSLISSSNNLRKKKLLSSIKSISVILKKRIKSLMIIMTMELLVLVFLPPNMMI